jgi:DNA-binding MarR family transcriptional regulator
MAQSGKTNPVQTETFLELMHTLERIDPEFPLNYSICLAQIAMHEGLSLTQLAERTGLALSTVSRIVGALSTYRQNGQSYGLIDMRVSAEERRRKELYLTSKGWALIRSIGSVLETYRPTGTKG